MELVPCRESGQARRGQKVSDDARIHLRIDSLAAPALLQRVATRDRFLDGRFEIDPKLSLGVDTERRARGECLIQHQGMPSLDRQEQLIISRGTKCSFLTHSQARGTHPNE